jgi:alpha-beta hydrolase superfamily lysophospholipase
VRVGQRTSRRASHEHRSATLQPARRDSDRLAHQDRAPLLLIAGGEGHTVLASVDRAVAKCYRAKSNAVTDFKELPGRSHVILGQEGWEEVADFALDWAVEHARGSAPVA